MCIQKPDIANPLKPTARTRKEMATPLLWEYPTTSSKVASMPNPDTHTHTLVIKVQIEFIICYISDRYQIDEGSRSTRVKVSNGWIYTQMQH